MSSNSETAANLGSQGGHCTIDSMTVHVQGDTYIRGFYVGQSKVEVAGIRFLAACVYAVKFVAEGQAKRREDVICEFVRKEQTFGNKHNAFLTDRVKIDEGCALLVFVFSLLYN